MIGTRDGLLELHMAAGSLGLVLGLVAMLSEGPPDYRSRAGAAYIALVTALLVVSLEGPAAAAGWAVPLLVGLAIIERHVARITRQETSPSAGRTT